MSCPDPEYYPEEHCACMCKNSRDYESCFEECMLDYDPIAMTHEYESPT